MEVNAKYYVMKVSVIKWLFTKYHRTNSFDDKILFLCLYSLFCTILFKHKLGICIDGYFICYVNKFMINSIVLHKFVL